MGFNISGIVINKNYENNLDELQKELDWNLEKDSEIDFETASENWPEEGIANIYFTDNGTLIFLDIEMCYNPNVIENANVLTFGLSETSMAFIVRYSENGEIKREIMEVDGNRIEDDGERLEVEDKSEDTSEIIWNQIEQTLGKSFWDIEPDEKAYKYLIQ